MATPTQELIEKTMEHIKQAIEGHCEISDVYNRLVNNKAELLKKEKKSICDAFTEGEIHMVEALRKVFKSVDFSKTDKEIKMIKEGIEPDDNAEIYYSKLTV